MSNPQAQSLVYQIDGQPYESRLVYDADIVSARPGLIMAPNWMGVSAGAERIAHAVAAQGYVVLLVDLYGQAVRPTNNDQAGAAMMPLRADRALLLKRMKAGLEQLKTQTVAGVDSTKLGAFGFCFGGCCALELARTGEPLRAAVSFHGTLDTPNPSATEIKGAVLVMHGDADPLVPKEQLPAFVKEMNDAKVDWQLIAYGGAYHSFTDPDANNPGVQMFDQKVSDRAFSAMYSLLDEVFKV